MQTFLPYPNFVHSAQCLDQKRLLNQRNEATIICDNIFPAPKKFKCKVCWDKGAIPFCEACHQTFVAPCSICQNKGGVPKCPKCGLPIGPRTVSRSWINHPATRMWKPYRWALICYTYEICRECRNRGYKDTVMDKLAKYGNYVAFSELRKNALPKWLGNPRLHSSHRSNLLRKDPTWYSKFNWTEHPYLPYYWPV